MPYKTVNKSTGSFFLCVCVQRRHSSSIVSWESKGSLHFRINKGDNS